MTNSNFLYEGYLTEKKTESVIDKVFNGYTVTKQKKFKNEPSIKQMSFDYYIEELSTVIEFNGDSHYCSSDVMVRDVMKEQFCIENNITHIEIPYFIQLDFEMIYYYFYNLDTKVASNIQYVFQTYDEPKFPHGFITNTIKLPASFCPKGQKKFMNEMCNLSGTYCFKGVIGSLLDKIEKKEDRLLNVNKVEDEIKLSSFLLAFESVIGIDSLFAKEFFPTVTGTTMDGAMEDQYIDKMLEGSINFSRKVRNPNEPFFKDCLFSQNWFLSQTGLKTLQTHHLPL